MAGQDQIRPQRREPDAPPADEPPGPPPVAPQRQISDAAIDDVLDEIDLVLETNAEEFVRGFVQKGGQ